MQHINNTTQVQFNAVLINEYRDGNDSISAHSDKEIIKPSNEVYGLSLGGTRTMHIVSKDCKDKHKVDINHGDLMIMEGNTQDYYTHEIRKQANRTLRISLTFRALAYK